MSRRLRSRATEDREDSGCLLPTDEASAPLSASTLLGSQWRGPCSAFLRVVWFVLVLGCLTLTGEKVSLILKSNLSPSHSAEPFSAE